jgi:hypothetical protein
VSRLVGSLGERAHPRAWLLLLRSLVYATGIVVTYYVLPFPDEDSGNVWVRLTIGLLVLAAVLGWQIYLVATTDYPALQAVNALALAVPLLLVIFSTAYIALSTSDPGAFSERLGRTSSLYFSMVTLATVGYGDIAARSDAARAVVMLQIVANLLILGIAGKVIFGMVAERRRPPV